MLRYFVIFLFLFWGALRTNYKPHVVYMQLVSRRFLQKRKRRKNKKIYIILRFFFDNIEYYVYNMTNCTIPIMGLYLIIHCKVYNLSQFFLFMQNANANANIYFIVNIISHLTSLDFPMGNTNKATWAGWNSLTSV